MLDNLQKLGFTLDIDRPAKQVTVHGRSGAIPSPAAELFCGNSGTTIRFLTALCSLASGRFTLDGNERMRQRPIAPLIDLLNNLGVRTTYLPKSNEIELVAAPIACAERRVGGGT